MIVEVYLIKKLVSLLLVIVLIVSCCSFAVSAEQIETEPKSTVEYFEDGSYVVTVLEESNSLARTGKSGKKTSTYYNSDDEPMYAVTLTGTFSYTYGVSAEATGASTQVITYVSEAKYVSKTATYRNATAYGSGTVSYLGYTRVSSVNITCDIYGKLS